MQKIKIGHRANFRAKNECFRQILFPVRALLCSINFRYADFNTDSADPCILVRACVDCARVQLKTLSSLLNMNFVLKPLFCTNQDSKYYFTLSLLFAAVQNERDTISKRPRGEDPENRHGLTTNVLLSAEILSRPATSPPGSLLGYVLGNTTLVKHQNILQNNIYTARYATCQT